MKLFVWLCDKHQRHYLGRKSSYVF